MGSRADRGRPPQLRPASACLHWFPKAGVAKRHKLGGPGSQKSEIKASAGTDSLQRL